MRTVLLACVASAALLAQAGASLDAELEKGRQLLQQHEYFNALKQYQRANQLAGGKSGDAFYGMALAAQGMKTAKNALDFAQSAIDNANGNLRLVARAHKLRGQVFADNGDPQHGEEAYRAALAADPESNIADLHYGLALALLAQQRDDEAIAELKKEIEIRPHGTTAEEAQAIIANPRRGREKYAPEFSISTADGQAISLASLHGKAVLLEFRAGSSGASARALPTIRKLVAAHSADPLVVIGISEDDDAGAWRGYIEKSAPAWPQHLDEHGRLANLFDVQTIPTYIVLDWEGIERLRIKGAADGHALTEAIEKEIARARSK